MTAPIKRIDNYYYNLDSGVLGAGVFGQVFKAIDEETHHEVAVKVVPTDKIQANEREYNLLKREVKILSQIKGEYIVRLLNIKKTSHNFYLFMEYCDGGDLEKQIKSHKSFTEPEACKILKQIVKAFLSIGELDILNENGQSVMMMHRDIKPANILFHKGKVKVADFGFAKFIEDADPQSTNSFLGTPLYMAPQLLNKEAYGIKCDIWAAGVLFYEVLFGAKPWTGHSVSSLYKNIQSQELSFPKEVSEDVKDLLRKMLKKKEEERPSWKEVYEHPALKKIEL